MTTAAAATLVTEEDFMTAITTTTTMTTGLLAFFSLASVMLATKGCKNGMVGGLLYSSSAHSMGDRCALRGSLGSVVVVHREGGTGAVYVTGLSAEKERNLVEECRSRHGPAARCSAHRSSLIAHPGLFPE